MKKLAFIVGVLTLPVVSFAQQLDSLKTLVESIREIIDMVIPIMVSIALLGFFYGLVRYIFGKEDDKAQAKKTMIWGVVALFVMVTVWGLVAFIGDSVGIAQDPAPAIAPLIPVY